MLVVCFVSGLRERGGVDLQWPVNRLEGKCSSCERGKGGKQRGFERCARREGMAGVEEVGERGGGKKGGRGRRGRGGAQSDRERNQDAKTMGANYRRSPYVA